MQGQTPASPYLLFRQILFFAFMTVGTLLTVFRLLTSRAAAMRTGDILFLLRLGFHLVVLRPSLGCATEDNASFNYIINICHRILFWVTFINGGTSARL